MNRWLMIATLVFSLGMSALGRHAAAAEQKMPAPGETVGVDGDAAKLGLASAFLRHGPKVGDPDSVRFDEPCSLELPLTVTVLGVFDATIVARCETGSKTSGMFSCAGIVLLDAESWQSLQALARESERLKADKEYRKAKVRALMPVVAPLKK